MKLFLLINVIIIKIKLRECRKISKIFSGEIHPVV